MGNLICTYCKIDWILFLLCSVLELNASVSIIIIIIIIEFIHEGCIGYRDYVTQGNCLSTENKAPTINANIKYHNGQKILWELNFVDFTVCKKLYTDQKKLGLTPSF